MRRTWCYSRSSTANFFEWVLKSLTVFANLQNISLLSVRLLTSFYFGLAITGNDFLLLCRKISGTKEYSNTNIAVVISVLSFLVKRLSC